MKQAYANFLDTCRSEYTKKTYDKCLNQFMKFVNIQDYEDLLKIDVEARIKQFIMREKIRVSSARLDVQLSSIYHFYDMNDVLINKVKLSKFKGEFRRVKRDTAYSHEDIGKLLQIADIRMKVCILLMSGSGIRVGAIPDLKLRHLQENKLTVYENSNEEYYTFVTPECAKYIKEYIDYRQRTGERVTQESYLIRNRFDSFGAAPPRVVEPAKIGNSTIRFSINRLLKRAGIEAKASETHGFRKFFTTQCINARINPEIREMLLGHKIGLTGHYYRPSEIEMYAEYENAIDNLTINEENRLKKKLRDEQQNTSTLLSRIESIEKSLGFTIKV